jgi:hypothetical protein
MSGADYPQGRLFSTGRRARGRARLGSDRTVKALRELGRLEQVDEALIVAARCAADNVDAAERLREADEASPYVVAGAIRTWAQITGALLTRAGVIDTDETEELWRELAGDPAPPPNG